MCKRRIGIWILVVVGISFLLLPLSGTFAQEWKNSTGGRLTIHAKVTGGGWSFLPVFCKKPIPVPGDSIQKMGIWVKKGQGKSKLFVLIKDSQNEVRRYVVIPWVPMYWHNGEFAYADQAGLDKEKLYEKRPTMKQLLSSHNLEEAADPPEGQSPYDLIGACRGRGNHSMAPPLSVVGIVLGERNAVELEQVELDNLVINDQIVENFDDVHTWFVPNPEAAEWKEHFAWTRISVAGKNIKAGSEGSAPAEVKPAAPEKKEEAAAPVKEKKEETTSTATSTAGAKKGENLLVNGSFEEVEQADPFSPVKLKGWSPKRDETRCLLVEGGHESKHCIMVKPGPWTYWEHIQAINLIPGKKYEISGWMKGERNGLRARIALYRKGSGGKYENFAEWPLTTEWKEYSKVIEVKPDCRFAIAVWPLNAEEKGNLYFDDLSIILVTE